MKHLDDRILEQVCSRIDEVKKLVILNRPLLEELRGAFDDPMKTRKLAAQLQKVDMLLSYLREIGVALAFLSMCREAFGDVVKVIFLSPVLRLREPVEIAAVSLSSCNCSLSSGAINRLPL